MWGKIIIPIYRLWLHGLYGLYGPRCPLSSKRPINLIYIYIYIYIYISSSHRYTPAYAFALYIQQCSANACINDYSSNTVFTLNTSVNTKIFYIYLIIIIRHWTFKMLVRYRILCVCLRLSLFSQLSFIQYVRLCVFSLLNFPVMIARMCTLSFHHHQIGSMNHWPLFRARSWNNGTRRTSYRGLLT